MKFSQAALAALALASAVCASQPGAHHPRRRTDAATHHAVAASDCHTEDDGSAHCHADTSQLDLGTDATIDVELPSGHKVSFDQNPETVASATSWSGSSAQEGDATFLTKTDANGNPVVYASLTDAERKEVCQVGPDADGKETVRCVPVSQFHDEDDPLDRRTLRQLRGHGNVASNHTLSASRDLQTTSTLDILVLWSKKAECLRAGLSQGCTVTDTTNSGMRGLVELAIEETNQAYAASGINAKLRLVHAYREPTYVEPSSDAFGTTLSRLQQTSDGWLDDVHQKRLDYGADLVAMLIDDGNSCGIGYVGPSKSWMFSVTGWSCATGHYTFGHEVGHNLGCNHDRGTKDCASGYNYGYRDPQAQFRTVLAYNCVSGQCDNNAGGGCTRVKRFSNPNTPYQGKATGIANQADCARHTNEVRAEVASYYNEADCPELSGYTFERYMDSRFNDIEQFSGTLDEMAQFCSSNSNCKAFNTNGWMKHTVASSLSSYSYGGPCSGVYIKNTNTGSCNSAGCQDCLSNKFGTGIRGCQCNACENMVCAQDSFCCNTEWDGLCQGLAEDICTMCGTTTTNPPTNPPTERPTERPTPQPTQRPTERPTPQPVGNIASGANAWASAGSGNTASGAHSAVSGGFGNTASGEDSVVAGGTENAARGDGSAVAGGWNNEADGSGSYVGGGVSNEASGDYSAAWGSNAHATHDRSAVFDFSNAGCDSTIANSVEICAENGLIVNGKNVDNAIDYFMTMIQTLSDRIGVLERGNRS